VGDRPRRLNGWIQAFDDQRRALLDELAALPPEALKAKARPDKWSILEIVEHLVLAERFVLGGLRPAAELVARPRSLKNRCIYPIVLFVLKFSIPVKVPAKRMLPTGQASLADVRSAWDENLRWLRAYVAGLAPGGGRSAVFLHPVAGPITLTQALRMDRLHFAVHLRQIRRLQAPG
jgi:DinB superfamily